MKKEIRVTTGIAKNKRLKSPDIEDFRAVQEIAKSSLFSILGGKINNATCLDLYAGSGNLGIEALSRGADWCDFVDSNPKSTQVIEENLVNCGFIERAEVIRKDVLKFLVNAPRNYDVVFIDPFYKDTTHKYLVSNLENILNKDGIVVFFHGDNLNLKNLTISTNLKVADERKFGKSYFTLLTL
ncbi:16S rRNA (guanine(966)-N(2))-methyltransferase RsmD [candidate division WWE3 bacterium]|uniref:16S rRNA (Guanine(966)-N(2))-methyltransferase RsmD n=1 Tax=candidate division WWE3 bacterium TaxID=2053526 RepID=A0A7X9E6W3_UNCKA|nr:16S rRNA (guanine(966)-N(2))-methyltransferase RsmD [candidate division WWE3 bacterium]